MSLWFREEVKTLSREIKLKHIVVAIIRDHDNRLLIAKRKAFSDQVDLWELPGGKVELDETPLQAMVREVREEVGLEVINASSVKEFTHHYPDKTLQFYVFAVDEYQGRAHGAEGQEVRWISQDEYANYQFPPANAFMQALLF